MAVNEYSFEPMPLNSVFPAHSMNYHYLLLVAFFSSILFLKEEFMTKGLRLEDRYFNRLP